jgi:hypothetical protein
MSNSMNRRAILAGAATLPAISIPAFGAEPDPAFAAIEAYKTAFDAFIARARYEDDLGRDKLGLAPGDYGNTPEMQALVDSANATQQALAETVPTTLAGLAAVLKCVAEASVDDFLFEDEEAVTFVRSIERAVIRLAR